MIYFLLNIIYFSRAKFNAFAPPGILAYEKCTGKRDGSSIHCTGEIAARHVAVMETMRAIQPDAVAFPTHWLREKNEYTYVPGLARAMYECFDKACLPDWDLSADKLGDD